MAKKCKINIYNIRSIQGQIRYTAFATYVEKLLYCQKVEVE